MRPRLVEIDPVADPRWDELVGTHRDATVYHLGDFAEILQRCYGFEPCYLGLEDTAGRLVAGMPLMRTRGLYPGSRVMSLPFTPRAGPLAATGEDTAVLLHSACELAREAGTRVLIRSQRAGYEELVPELRATSTHPLWLLRLPSDPEELRRRWRKGLRHNVKQSEANGLTVRDAESERDLRRFHRLYTLSAKRFGMAPRPYRQMALSWRILGRSGRVKVVLVERKGKLLAGGLFHLLRGVIEFRYLAADPRQYMLRPNHALYWYAQRWAIENGYHSFDMGGGEGSLGAFKRRWGAEPASWTRYVQDSASGEATRGYPPIEECRTAAGSEARTAFVWRHCPAPLARLASGPLFRYLADPTR